MNPSTPTNNTRSTRNPSAFEDILAQDRPRDHGEVVRKRLHLWLPILATAGILALIGVIGGWDFLVSVVFTAVTTFFALGKFVILFGMVHTDLGPWPLALMVFYMDCITAIVLAYNLDVVYRIPRVGPSLNRLQNYGRYTLRQNPYLRRVSFIGIILFVLFPIAATGAVGGSILGRLVGMKPYRLVMAIALGSALGCSALAVFTDALRDRVEFIRHELWFQVSGIALIGLLVLFLWRRYLAIDRKIADGSIDISEGGTR